MSTIMNSIRRHLLPQLAAFLTISAVFVFPEHLAAQEASISDDSPFIVVLGIAQDGGIPHGGTVDHPAWNDPSLRRRAVCLGIIDPATSSRGYLRF